MRYRRCKKTDNKMSNALICVPSELPGGLEAILSDSLEDSDIYNFVEIDKESKPLIISLASQRYSCHSVSCLDPVEAIVKKGASVLIVKAIGPDYLLRFLESPVRVLISNEKTVLDSVKRYITGQLAEMTRKDFSASSRKEKL